MVRAICMVSLGVCFQTSAAGAQPGGVDPGAYRAPAQSGYGVRLTPEEHEVVTRGEIGPGALVVGGLLGTFYGFGIGHAVQGRWADHGWKFTVGEAVGGGLLISGLVSCFDGPQQYAQTSCGDEIGLIVIGTFTYLGFRIWEAYDVWQGAARHNQRVRSLRYRAGYGPQYGLYIAPTGTNSGVAGLTVRF